MKAILSKEAGGYDLYRINEEGKRVTFASTQDFKQKLSLKNCEAIANGYDLDELALEFCYPGNGVRDKFQAVFRGVFKDGFRKALELLEHRLSKETEWQVEIVMDICGDKVYAVPEPALDEKGCLILKKIDN